VRACARARVRLCACARFFFCVCLRAFVCLRAIHMCVFVVLYMCVQLQGSGNLCVYFCASSSAPGGGGQWVEGFNVCVEVQILLVGVLCAASLARSTFPLPSSSVPSAVKQCSLSRQAVFPLPSARVRVSISLSLSSVSLLHPCSVCLRLPLTPPSSTLFVWSSRMMIDQLGCQARRAHHSRRRLRANCGEALALACPPRCTVYRGPCLIV